MCWFLDFIGILTGMVCAGIGFVYLSFHCHPDLLHFGLCGIILGYLLSIRICWKNYRFRTSKAVLIPCDRFPEFSRVLSTYGAITTVVPVVIAMLFIPEYTSNSAFLSVLVHSVLGPIYVALGIICFAQGNFPERFASLWGVREDFFDLFGHSHQLWHFVSAGLQFMWIYLSRKHFFARVEYGCSNPMI